MSSSTVLITPIQARIWMPMGMCHPGMGGGVWAEQQLLKSSRGAGREMIVFIVLIVFLGTYPMGDGRHRIGLIVCNVWLGQS